MKYEGFVFGHYDSRGGAVFIAAKTEAEARRAYVTSGASLEDQIADAKEWGSDEAQAQGAHPMWKEVANATEEEAIRLLSEEDFWGPATIEAYRELQDNEDLEFDTDEDDTHHRLFANYSPTHDGEKPALVEFRLVEEAIEETEDNKKSEWGEDAYGLIFITA